MATRTVTVLNVAEKPSVAKSVSAILSRNQGLRVREGRSRYNKIFEFTYSIRGQPCQMLFTSVTGHLMELEFEDRYRKWHSCDPADLYHAPVRKFVPEDKKDIKRTLEEEARRCQWLVLWLDCDREGENIAFEVVDVCTAANRYVTLKRARFSALIDREIHNAVQNLVEPNKWFADAVDARQEIDLRIGASFTRFQTMLLRDAFIIDTPTDDRNLVLSYGPCQFPTLGFVVERYWEIQAHEPEEFWLINCSHRSDEGVANFSWMRGHLFDYTCAVIIYEMCTEEPNATVTNVKQQEKLKYPPYPLNTIELEKRASRYFRMSSEHTMKVAEELYQAGFISYPRTETDSFSSRTDLHTIVQEQQGHPEWGIYAQRLLDPGTGLWRNPRGGGHDDKAHPPIHPTKFSAGEAGWSQDHRKLYELVVRHFLACVSKPAVGAETIVEIDIAGEQFSVCGRVILEFIPTALTLDSGVTRPPPLLSEADLLSSMDKEGIGTDATMHDHIKKLLDRFYVTKDSSTRFTPTNLGEALVMGYDDMGYKLWKPDLRAVMERDMKSVSEGVKSKDEVLANSLQQMKACFLDVSSPVYLIQFKFRQLEIPPNYSVNHLARARGPNTPTSHANQSNTRQGLCTNCQQTGHSSNDCPSQNLGSRNAEHRRMNQHNGNVGPVYLIQFKFRQLEIPPNYSVNHLARARGPNTPTSHANQSNTRQGLCTNCQQTGHSSNDCPSQNLGSRNAEHRRMNQHNGNVVSSDSVLAMVFELPLWM
ncbi:hypothetical protein TanjilG_25961 [Lupinus angustifolius]|uniref:DNA topoisomerase n=1 Tax=Lupinus angustifolius TaxID=3871 RepID=A0A4P1QZ64_LUPAN|nr:hypothetical protein TanjilG_25961 [Lupinus angustifolius]